MKEQVIEMIARICSNPKYPNGASIEWGEQSEYEQSCARETAQAILDLCYPCAECKGSGKKDGILKPCFELEPYQCPACKGTGKGNKVIGILDQDQSYPVNPYKYERKDTGMPTIERIALKHGYDDAQFDMIRYGWRKTV